MKNKGDKISAFDAKTHLSELLRETEAGRAYTILRRGKPVAELTPPRRKTKASTFKELAALFDEFRQGIRGKVKVKSLIEEGRR